MASITPAENRAVDSTVDIEKNPANDENVNEVMYDEKLDSEDGSTHKQDGVKRVEAITTVWTKKTLVLMFILLYLVSFVELLMSSINSNLTAYVTSAFYSHGLLGATGIVATIAGGVSAFTIAKIIDIWGRVEGFLLMLLVVSLGLIMKAVCKNVTTYAAAHTFYWVGHLGLLYVIDVMLADMTTLKNRMLAFTINGTPTIATTFAGPAIAELFYEQSTWRWAFGAFCIILIGVSIPAAAVMLAQQRKAARLGALPERVHKRTRFESFKFYVVEFDILGLLLCTAAFSLILLPFSLANGQSKGWASGTVISMLVVGTVSMIAFVLWERFFAPVQFFPFKYLMNRTIIGSSLLYGFMFASIFCWDTYYYSYLQVVHDQNISNSGYILNAFSLTSSFISPFIGFLISRTGDFKWTAYGGIPFVVLGTALLIHLRTPSTHVGLLVMCQVFNGIGTGIWATCAQLAVMASVSHQEVAVAIALWGMFGSIGAAIGQAIAGALWTNILPKELYKALPEESKNLTATIYSSFVIQQDYPVGTVIRDAIIVAYADVQRKMVVAGSAFMPVCVLAIVLWKRMDVRKMEKEKTQSKGTIW
ncbi:putative transporter [Cadophora sp. DSE1049]|nr:putative transporter [Cadophora sp. DSE1049]